MRTGLRHLHRSAGLLAGVLLSVLGLSGSLLVFRPELERMARPGLFTVVPGPQTASVDEMREALRRERPELDVYRVNLPRGETDPYEFLLGTGGRIDVRAYVNPYTGRVLGTRTADTDPFLWLQSLHFDLLAGERGRKVNGAVAALLLLLCASGLGLWLRASARCGPRLRPRWRVRPARRTWGLHVAGGFWAMPLLSLMAFSALYFAFHDPVARFVDLVTRSRPRPPAPAVAQQAALASLDALLASGRGAAAGGRPTMLRLPRASGQAAILNFTLPGDLSDLGANVVYLNPYTAAAVRVERLSELPLGSRITAALVPLHFGTFGGVWTRLLWAGLGLTPGALFATGLWMWRRRSRPARSRQPSAQAEIFMEVGER